MKKAAIILIGFLTILVCCFPLHAFEESPQVVKVVPECIWALATGGGTWVTGIQITNTAATATITCYFDHAGGRRGPFILTSNLAPWHSVKYTNILSTLDTLDADDFNYYGRVGAITFYTTSYIQVESMTINGNYGKTFPGLSVHEANLAAVNRVMIIQNLINNPTYRTFTGFVNCTGETTYTIKFDIYDANATKIGNTFYKTFTPNLFMAFNPFIEAGVDSGTYDNCRLTIDPQTGLTTGGIMCFGAIANNNTNDPAALIAKPQ